MKYTVGTHQARFTGAFWYVVNGPTTADKNFYDTREAAQDACDKLDRRKKKGVAE
jgi:hypothetical protein